MPRLICAALAAVAAATIAFAEEPSIPEQIPPIEPQWHVLKIGEKGTEMLEATTMGRVGDTGYVWLGRFSEDYRTGPALIRMVIDCPTSTITYDWAILYTALPELAPAVQGATGQTFVAETENDRSIVDFVCVRGAIGGLPILGLTDAEKFAKTASIIADLVPLPGEPDLQFVGRQDDIGYVFLDGPTAFKVEDRARVWLARINPVPLQEPPLWVHWLIDCTSGSVTPDWQVEFNDGYDIVKQSKPGTPLFAPDADNRQRIVAAACEGAPVTIGEAVGTVDDAIIFTNVDAGDRALSDLVNEPGGG